jgi:hypothetical protein
MEIEDAGAQGGPRFRSGAAPPAGRNYGPLGDFLAESWNDRNFVSTFPPIRGGLTPATLIERLVNLEGSRGNRGVMVILEEDLNLAKAIVCNRSPCDGPSQSVWCL